MWNVEKTEARKPPDSIRFDSKSGVKVSNIANLEKLHQLLYKLKLYIWMDYSYIAVEKDKRV